MLNQISQLTIDTDGRYATSEELDFIREYVASAKTRVKIYRKIREMRSDILFETERQMLGDNENLFTVNGKDYKSFFHRDQGIELKYTAATILSGDLDRIKQSLLLWYRTIMNAAKPAQVKKWTEMTYQVKPKVILDNFTPQEQEYLKPILATNQAVLGHF